MGTNGNKRNARLSCQSSTNLWLCFFATPREIKPLIERKVDHGKEFGGQEIPGTGPVTRAVDRGSSQRGHRISQNRL